MTDHRNVYDAALGLFPYRVGQEWYYNVAYQGECLERVTIVAIEFAITEAGVKPAMWAQKRHCRPFYVEPVRLVRMVEGVAA